MLKFIMRTTVTASLSFAVYQGYLWWTHEEVAETEPVIGCIIQGNGNGSETVLWARKR